MTHTYTKSEWMNEVFSWPRLCLFSSLRLLLKSMTRRNDRKIQQTFSLCLFSSIKQFLKSMKHRTDRTLQKTFMSFVNHQAIPEIYETHQWHNYSADILLLLLSFKTFMSFLNHQVVPEIYETQDRQNSSADIYVFSHPSSNSWSLWHTAITELFSRHLCLFSSIKQFLKSMAHSNHRTLQ